MPEDTLEKSSKYNRTEGFLSATAVMKRIEEIEDMNEGTDQQRATARLHYDVLVAIATGKCHHPKVMARLATSIRKE